MIKGTTPTHTFKLSLDTADVKEVKITYAQDNLVKIVKRTEACEISGDQVTVRLTQEETFELNHHRPVLIQLRVLTVSGDALASKVISVPAHRCLDTEVLK